MFEKLIKAYSKWLEGFIQFHSSRTQHREIASHPNSHNGSRQKKTKRKEKKHD
jgi:hypothetical protein